MEVWVSSGRLWRSSGRPWESSGRVNITKKTPDQPRQRPLCYKLCLCPCNPFANLCMSTSTTQAISQVVFAPVQPSRYFVQVDAKKSKHMLCFVDHLWHGPRSSIWVLCWHPKFEAREGIKNNAFHRSKKSPLRHSCTKWYPSGDRELGGFYLKL